MTKRQIGNIFTALVVVTVFITLFVRSYFIKAQFYCAFIHSKVIDSSDYPQATMPYYLDNGLQVHFLKPVKDKIIVGDSVFKDSNTYMFMVYRKGRDSQYRFCRLYDFESLN